MKPIDKELEALRRKELEALRRFVSGIAVSYKVSPAREQRDRWHRKAKILDRTKWEKE